MAVNVDWSKIIEGSILVIPTAVISGFIGARVKAYVDRGRPAISVTGCRLGGTDDIEGRVMVNVPTSLSEETRINPWIEKIAPGPVSAATVLTMVAGMQGIITRAREGLAIVENLLTTLPSATTGSVEEKLHFLDKMSRSESGIIDASITGALVRKELILSLPPNDELVKCEPIGPFEEDDELGGYRIDFGFKHYSIFYKKGRTRDRTFLLPYTKALSFFHAPAIRQSLEHVKKDLTGVLLSGDGVVERLTQVARQGQPLVVDVSIVNRGRAPLLFTPWALLHLFHTSTGTSVEVDLAAVPSRSKQGNDESRTVNNASSSNATLPRFNVEPGRVVTVHFHSLRPINELEAAIPNLTGILNLDLFNCQVVLKRADVKGAAESWVASAVARFGKRADSFPAEERSLANRVVNHSGKRLAT